jgi:hypothetical protein
MIVCPASLSAVASSNTSVGSGRIMVRPRNSGDTGTDMIRRCLLKGARMDEDEEH